MSNSSSGLIYEAITVVEILLMCEWVQRDMSHQVQKNFISLYHWASPSSEIQLCQYRRSTDL